MVDPAILAITETALRRVHAFMADLPDPSGHALTARITGEADGEWVCALALDPLSRARAGDTIQPEGELSIVIAADSVARLRGATIDWTESPLRSGFLVVNPNKPPKPLPALPTLPTLPMSMSPGRGASMAQPPAPRGDLHSEVAQRVIAVLDREINPSIAAHGGHAELAGIEGRTAYLRLGGGCVGCGMASVTLSQGIEVAITEAVPEIADVVDVTDHASGTNPYFEPAKK